MKINILNVWGPGQLFAFSGIDGKTDFKNGLVLRTAYDYTGFEIKLPVEHGNIKFSDAAPKQILLGGDFFDIDDIKGAMPDAWHVLISGYIEFSDLDPAISVMQNDNLTLIGVTEYFKPEYINLSLPEIIGNRQAWLNSLSLPENILDNTKRALYKACSQLKTMLCSPEGQIKHLWSTPDRWPHQHMWLWDSVFHAMGLRHLDPQMARDIISAVLDCQRQDGFIALDATPEQIHTMTQPPVLALGVQKVLEVEDAPDWLRKCYPALKEYIEWDLANRDSDGAGLLEWFIEANETCRSGESGMDNSPRFDCADQLDATDFNSFIARECEIMAEFAATLGLDEDVGMWLKRYQKLCGLINERLWDEDAEFYVDYDVTLGKKSEVLASSGFLPLLCGAASPQQAQKLADHLNDPESFGTPLIIPSISRKSEEFYQKDMWRGPVWVNINCLIAEGFKRYGLDREADMIIYKTIAEQERLYLEYGTFFEFMDDRNETPPPALLRKAKNIPNSFHQVFHDYGWSATLYIDMIFSRSSNHISSNQFIKQTQEMEK